MLQQPGLPLGPPPPPHPAQATPCLPSQQRPGPVKAVALRVYCLGTGMAQSLQLGQKLLVHGFVTKARLPEVPGRGEGALGPFLCFLSSLTLLKDPPPSPSPLHLVDRRVDRRLASVARQPPSIGRQPVDRQTGRQFGFLL